MPLLLVGLLLPLLLLLLMLAMERVEQPLTRAAAQDRPVDLDAAGPDGVEAFASNGYGPALGHYRRRRRLSRLLGLRARSSARSSAR